jgi:glycerol-3-phosphate acyltransferase PlsY
MIAVYITCVILACLVGYVLGSLPFSVWIGKLATGVDLRNHGVKNPGGMNAAATYGLKIGLPIILLDFLKGTTTILLIDQLFALDFFISPEGINIWHTLASILGPTCCILGHNYSIFLKFKGGQGLGVFLGVIYYLNPILFVFYGLGIIVTMLLFKANVRIGTLVIIILEIFLLMFIRINPPWSNMPEFRFPWTPWFMQIKLPLILLGMFAMIFIRALQAIRKQSASATWRVSNDGKREFRHKDSPTE